MATTGKGEQQRGLNGKQEKRALQSSNRNGTRIHLLFSDAEKLCDKERDKERKAFLVARLFDSAVCVSFFLFELVSAFTAGEKKSARRLTNSSLLFSPLRSSHLRFASCFWRALLRDGLRCSKEPNNESGLVGGRAQQAEIREPDKELLTMLQFTITKQQELARANEASWWC